MVSGNVSLSSQVHHSEWSWRGSPCLALEHTCVLVGTMTSVIAVNDVSVTLHDDTIARRPSRDAHVLSVQSLWIRHIT